jgi:hypothetical protein
MLGSPFPEKLIDVFRQETTMNGTLELFVQLQSSFQLIHKRIDGPRDYDAIGVPLKFVN